MKLTEAGYQKQIMKDIEKAGGVVVNGIYTKTGELDLQAGIPIYDRLHYLGVEVKTEENYYRVMSGLRLEDDNTYTITDIKKLKKHESLQVYKVNRIRDRGGLALFAYKYDQIVEYIEGEGL